MVKKLGKIIIFSFLLNLLLIGFVFAQGKELEVKYPEIFGYAPKTFETTLLPDYVKYIFNFIIVTAGVIALGALIYGGIRFLTSTGQPEKIKIARNQILTAFFGIIILFSSYLILTTINPQLVILDLPMLEKITIPVLPYQPPLVPPVYENYLWRITEIADSVKEIAINEQNGLKKTAGDLKSLTSNCDCQNTQPLCVCIDPSTAKKIAIKKIYSLEYLDSDLLALLKNYPETPCDIFHCSLFNTTSLRALATKQLPGTNTFIAQSETEVIENAIQSGKDVYTDEQLKKINKANISILHSEDFIAKHNEYVDQDLKDGCIAPKKADFLKENASLVTAATDRQGNLMVNKEKVEAGGIERAAGTFTHEYAHVIDGPEFQSSHSDEWKKIYSQSMGYKFEYKEKRLQEVIEWKEKGGELPPAVKSPGFVSDYAYYGGEHEDFAETVKVYRETGGDPNQISNDTKTQQLVKKRFEFLEEKEIVRPDYKYKKPEEEPNKKTDNPPLDVNLSSLAAIQSQLIQFSNLSSNTGTCYGVRCYAGPGFQPCPNEQEIKRKQQNLIASLSEILYYENRAAAERKDFLLEIENLKKEIAYYEEKIKEEGEYLAKLEGEYAKEEQEKLIKKLEETKEKLINRQGLYQDLERELNELSGLINEIAIPTDELFKLPDECLLNVKEKCQGSCSGGCHDTKGCFPNQCSGGNPCPTNDIMTKVNEIDSLTETIKNTSDKIIKTITEIVRL